MRPEAAIDSWRQWGADLHSRPKVARSLSGGRSNHSFLLAAHGVKMALRINNEATQLPGIGRDQEVRIWHAASTAGIAPALLHVDHQHGFLVSAFIESRLPSESAANAGLLQQAFDLLDRCHMLVVNAKSIDYAGHIEHYWKIIDAQEQSPSPALLEMRQPMHALLNELIQSDAQTGLCHHDPVVANFVGGPELLYLIDWEYAARGFIVMDYAALAAEWGIEDAIILEKTSLDPELFARAKQLYTYLCALWEEAVGRTTGITGSG